MLFYFPLFLAVPASSIPAADETQRGGYCDTTVTALNGRKTVYQKNVSVRFSNECIVMTIPGKTMTNCLVSGAGQCVFYK
jgi:hypothetical protein